jgi:GNAT superfamily N-acetyltransferase
MPSLINDAQRPANDPTRLSGDTSLLNGDPLRSGAPTLADAYSYNAHALADWVAAQRAVSAERGLWDEAKGAPTAAGARDAAMQVAQGVALASTAPGEVPKPSPFKIGEPEMLNYQHGQKDLIVRAHDSAGNQIGSLNYSEYGGVPQIDYINVDPSMQRHGVGSALVNRVAEDYGGYHGIEWSNQTDEGAALKAALDSQHAIRAFHGSPAEFPPTPNNPLGEFDNARIGSGEGAQAFGYGHYVAGNEGVAKGYRDALRRTDYPTSTGGYIPDWVGNSIDRVKDDPNLVKGVINGHLQDFEGRLADAQSEMKTSHQPWLAQDRAVGLQRIIDDLKGIRSGDVTMLPRGHMYEVEIAADPQHFLDWDKPLSEQSKQVQQAMGKVLTPSNLQEFTAGQGKYMTGGEMHDFIGGRINSQQIAGQMQQAGIPGIKYLDAGSRGAGEGTSNYVVFDPSIMRIVRKYAVPAFATGSAIPAAMGGSAQDSQ